MKRLGKLTISPGKIMKNEELINLQGGYEADDCTFDCMMLYCIPVWESDTCTANCGQSTCNFSHAKNKS